MKPSILCAVLVASFSLLAALSVPAMAASTEKRIDCTTFGMTLVAGPPERIHLRGFSLPMPGGGNWCTSGPNVTNTGVDFLKITEYGKTEADVTAEEKVRSFFLKVRLQEVPEGAVANIDALLSFTRSQRDQYHGGRFALLDFEAVRSDLAEFQCVRLELSQLERENPHFPGLDLTIEVVDYLCVNPRSVDTVIDIAYSERYIKDRRPGPSLMITLAPEIEQALQGLQVELDEPPMSEQAIGLIVFAALAGLGFLGWIVVGIVAVRREKSDQKLSRAAFAPWWATPIGLVLFAFLPPWQLSPALGQMVGLAILAFTVIAPPVFAFFFFQRVVWRARDGGFSKRIAYFSIAPVLNIVTIAILALAPPANMADSV